MARILFLSVAILASLTTTIRAAAYFSCGDDVSVSMISTDYEFYDEDAGLGGNDLTASFALTPQSYDSASSIESIDSWFDYETGGFYVNSDSVDWSGFNNDLDSVCRPDHDDTGKSFFSATWELGDCNPDITANATHILYTYTIWHQDKIGSPQDMNPIVRYKSWSVEFDCVFERQLDEVATTNPIFPSIIHTHTDIGEYEGDFTFSIFLSTSTYSTSLTSYSIDVDDWIYVTIELQETNHDALVIAADNCWAHAQPTKAGSSDLVYQFIDDHCPKSHDWDPAGSIEIMTSGTENYAHVKVKSFVWNSSSATKIYITCDATVGKEDKDYTDTSNCSGGATNTKRRRRRRRSNDDYKVTLMAGPLYVQ